MSEVNMSSPWTLFYREIEAMFGEDPAIKVVFDESACEIKLYVDGAAKADAIALLLPAEKTFGNVTVKITVIPSNKQFTDKAALFRNAFDGNPAFSYASTIDGVFTNPITYVVFAKRVVQYYADNLGDPHGMRSTLYQDIAGDVFSQDLQGVSFSTDV